MSAEIEFVNLAQQRKSDQHRRHQRQLGETDPLLWENYDLLIVTAGDNTSPYDDAGFRNDLVDFVDSGGHLLIEGGEVGYDHQSGDFATKVLHHTGWNHDESGNLTEAQLKAKPAGARWHGGPTNQALGVQLREINALMNKRPNTTRGGNRAEHNQKDHSNSCKAIYQPGTTMILERGSWKRTER